MAGDRNTSIPTPLRRIGRLTSLPLGLDRLENSWGTLRPQYNFRHFLLRPFCHAWHSRLWVVQEFALARESYFLHDGTMVKVSDLLVGFRRIYDHVKDSDRPEFLWTSGHGFVSSVERFRSTRRLEDVNQLQERCQLQLGQRGSRVDLPTTSTKSWTKLILQISLQRECFDPKDKVFAAYSLLGLLGLSLPPPDYAKSVEDIYTETTASIIRHEVSLHVLELLRMPRNLDHLPSWVPDLSVHADADDYLIPYLGDRLLVERGLRRIPPVPPSSPLFLSQDGTPPERARLLRRADRKHGRRAGVLLYRVYDRRMGPEGPHPP